MPKFFLRTRFLLDKKLCLKGKIERTKLSLVLKFGFLEQNKLPKKQKCNSGSDLKEKLMVKMQINELLCGIKLLRESRFCFLNDEFQINEILLESAFCLLILILILLLFLLFASVISSAWQIWQLLQQLLKFFFGSGPG
jgi:hypothetical protein